MASDFNELELAILEWFNHTYANSQIAAQIESARFLNRDWTKVGFYVYFEVSRELEPINLDDFDGQYAIDGPFLISDDIQHGGGTVLFITDGYIDCIEMYSFGYFFNETVNRFELVSDPPK